MCKLDDNSLMMEKVAEPILEKSTKIKNTVYVYVICIAVCNN